MYMYRLVYSYILLVRRDGKFFFFFFFELIEETGKDVFGLFTSVGQRKNSESPQRIEPQTFRFLAPKLYQ